MKETKVGARTEKVQWQYKPIAAHWDEAIRPSGMPRHHWRKLYASIGRMGFAQLTRRWQTGQHLIQTNGITYNVYGDPQGKERPWSLDPIPLVLDEQEWAGLEKAISQRAVLLNHMLGDLYGAQRLIHQRQLPAALLFGNPNFLRTCHGIRPNNGVFLHSYAVDLARSPNGRWWVLSDRTQAPSGMGYALENRLVSARTLPSAFSQCHVRPLNHFIDRYRETLLSLAPNRDNPRVVLLTPGPNNETYFEQSYLARQWGVPLVEGADLTVRDNRVFLKTLSGLDPVDMVIRRMDDSFCDPLELRSDSLLGIPGFTQAVRSGNVAVSNALGSGLMESPGYMAFLPGLCKQWMGEDLKLPSVATWWCGEEAARRFVMENLDGLVIKPAFPRRGHTPEFPAYLDSAAKLDLIRRIEADPEQFVAQEQVALSTAPVRTDTGLAPRHLVLRVFAVRDGDAYRVMPGGLTRVSTESNSPVVTMQLGGGSKDTWVLGDSEESHGSVAHVYTRTNEPRGAADLPSRVADNLFWLGRYGERVEAGVRMVRALLPGLSSEEDFGHTASIQSAVQLLSGLNFLPEEIAKTSITQQRWHVGRLLSGMVYDPSRTSSIGWNLNNLRRAAWPVKEWLSQDTWRVLQQLEAEFSVSAPVHHELRLVAEMNLLDRVIVTLSAFSGLVMENTTRCNGWHFLDIGRRLERALQTADLLLASLVDAPFDIEPSMDTLLIIADSSITYRTRYFTDVKVEFILQLLLCDESNPRSVGFQVATLVQHLRSMPANLQQQNSAEVQDDEHLPLLLAEKILKLIQHVPLDDMAARDSEGNLAALEELLRTLKGSLYDLSALLTAHHFSHVPITRFKLSF